MARRKLRKNQPPVSLSPLEPEVALAGLMRVKPEGKKMKVVATCGLCQHRVEQELEIEMEASRFAEALRFLREAAQAHHHPETSDSFKWRLGWEE